jgi:hypothetical protein
MLSFIRPLVLPLFLTVTLALASDIETPTVPTAAEWGQCDVRPIGTTCARI